MKIDELTDSEIEISGPVPVIRGHYRQSRCQRDQILATKIAIKAAYVERDSTIIAANCHMLSALYDIAAGKLDLARGQMDWIVHNVPHYDPQSLIMGRNLALIGPELAEFRREHMKFDYNKAEEMFDAAKRESHLKPREKVY